MNEGVYNCEFCIIVYQQKPEYYAIVDTEKSIFCGLTEKVHFH